METATMQFKYRKHKKLTEYQKRLIERKQGSSHVVLREDKPLGPGIARSQRDEPWKAKFLKELAAKREAKKRMSDNAQP